MRNFEQLVSTVQQNCHISDANYAGNYTMCTFLLKMREYYRWENDIPLSHKLPRHEVGNWLVEREQSWEDINTDEYLPLELEGAAIDPFDTDNINKILIPQGYVYSSGYGLFNKPHFFLGSLHDYRQEDDLQIMISAREYARDLVAPPAMMRNNTMFISRESLRRFIWEKIEDWQFRGSKEETPMYRALAPHGDMQHMEKLLDHFTNHELAILVQHELGEYIAGKLLGPQWEILVQQLPHKSALILRAMRDHLADCTTTLPWLLEEKNLPSLHFYMANFTGMRRVIFPELLEAYNNYINNNKLNNILKVVYDKKEHWESQCIGLMNRYSNAESTVLELIHRDLQNQYQQ